MRKETLEKWIGQLDGMIAALQQAVVLGGRSAKEGEACELLKDARLRLVEEIEEKQEYLDKKPTQMMVGLTHF